MLGRLLRGAHLLPLLPLRRRTTHIRLVLRDRHPPLLRGRHRRGCLRRTGRAPGVSVSVRSLHLRARVGGVPACAAANGSGSSRAVSVAVVFPHHTSASRHRGRRARNLPLVPGLDHLAGLDHLDVLLQELGDASEHAVVVADGPFEVVDLELRAARVAGDADGRVARLDYEVRGYLVEGVDRAGEGCGGVAAGEEEVPEFGRGGVGGAGFAFVVGAGWGVAGVGHFGGFEVWFLWFWMCECGGGCGVWVLQL